MNFRYVFNFMLHTTLSFINLQGYINIPEDKQATNREFQFYATISKILLYIPYESSRIHCKEVTPRRITTIILASSFTTT